MSIKTLKQYLLVASMLEFQPSFKGLNKWEKLVRSWGVK